MILEIESNEDKSTTFIEVTNVILYKEKIQVVVIGSEIKSLDLEENDRIKIYDNGVKLFSYKFQSEK